MREGTRGRVWGAVIPPEDLRVFALGMAAGHLAQARREPKALNAAGNRAPGRADAVLWRLLHAKAALGWLRTAAETS
jgi:hypothetical protein